MMNVRIRYATPNESREIFTLWQEGQEKDLISFGRFNDLMFCNGLDYKSLNIIAQIDGCIVGVLSAVINVGNHDAYIQCLTVKRDVERSEILDGLLIFLEESLRQKSISTITYRGFSKNYCLPGIDVQQESATQSWLLNHGFTETDHAVAMHRNLVGFVKKSSRIHQDYTILPFSDDHLFAVLELCRKIERLDWSELLQKEYVCKRYVCHGYICMYSKDIVVGFAFFGLIGSELDRFGPIGVDPDHRGKSIGKSLLEACLQAQSVIGCTQSYFLWGEDGSAAYNMYMDAGFTVFKQMAIMTKYLTQ